MRGLNMGLGMQAQGGAWSSTRLFTAGEQGFTYDISDINTLFQDTAGTSPVTAPAQTVARVNDKSGRGNHATQPTAASRPTYGVRPKTGTRNLLTGTAVMATQSKTVTAAQHTLSFKGTGTVTLTGVSTAGPLIGTGAANTVSLTFTPTAGSLTMTVSGSVTEAQLELGAARTAYQVVGTTIYDVTETGVPSVGYLAFDGTDDFLVTSAIDFSATDEMTVCAGVRKLSDATGFGVIVELSNSVNVNNGSFGIFGPETGATPTYVFYVKGSTATVVSTGTGHAAPITSVLSMTDKIGTDALQGRINATSLTAVSTDQGTGNFGNHAVYIGRRGGTSLPFNGHLTALTVRGKTTSAGDLTNLESWTNARTGGF